MRKWPYYTVNVSVISHRRGVGNFCGNRSRCCVELIKLALATTSESPQFCCYCPVKLADVLLKRVSSYGRTRHLSSPGLHRRGHQGGPPPEIQGGFSLIHCRCSAQCQRCPVLVIVSVCALSAHCLICSQCNNNNMSWNTFLKLCHDV